MDAQWEEILNEMKEDNLPLSQRAKVANNYFKRELEPEMLRDKLPREKQKQVRFNFLNTISEPLQDEPSFWKDVVVKTGKAIPRVVGATAGSLALFPGAGVAGLIEMATPGEGSRLERAGRKIEEVSSLPLHLIKTPEEEQAVETIGKVFKPIEMAGEGWQKIIELTPLKGTIAEPIAKTLGEVAAMYGIGGEGLRAIKTRNAKLIRGVAAKNLEKTMAASQEKAIGHPTEPVIASEQLPPVIPPLKESEKVLKEAEKILSTKERLGREPVEPVLGESPKPTGKVASNWKKALAEAEQRLVDEEPWAARGAEDTQWEYNIIKEVAQKYKIPEDILRKQILWEARIKREPYQKLTPEEVKASLREEGIAPEQLTPSPPKPLPPEPEPVKAEPTIKEPWEMTKGEYFNKNYSQEIKKSLESIKIEEQSSISGKKQYVYSLEDNKSDFAYKNKKEALDAAQKHAKSLYSKEASDNLHIYEIGKALSEGKPVPPEVLKDYPELAKPKPIPPKLEPLAGEEFVYQGVVHPSLESEYVSESLLTAAYHAERMQAIGAPAPGKTGEGVVRVFRKRDIDYSKKTQIGDYKLKDGTKPVKTLTPEEARILNNQAKAGKAKPTKGGETKSGLSSLAEEERRIDQSGKITFGKEKPKPDMDKFENPETESLYKSAVFQPEKLSSRVKDLLTQVKHKFTRTYEHLSDTPENTQLIFDLKQLEKQKEVSADKSARAVGEVLSTLDKKEADIFTRKVFLDDLMDDFNRGLYNKKDLPFKFTLDSLRKELQNKERQISVNPRLQEALTKRKEAWDALKAEYIRELRPYKPDVADMFKKESYYRHEVLDYMVDKGIFGTGKRLKTPYRGYMKERTGYGGLYNTDFLSAEHNIMSQMLYDIEVAKTLTRIKKIENVEGITKQIKEYAKAQGIKDWHEAIPEGYTAWQPREGNVFYRTLSIPEATMQKIMEGELAGIVELTPELKKVLAMGGKREEWVVREEVAKTLNNLVRERPTGMASRVNREVLTAWKKWQLISPRRYFKYNTRNLTGDAEAVFLGNPSGFKKSPQAFRELWNVFVEKKPMSKDMSAWFDRGGMSSTLQAQEMGALKKTWMFERLYEKKGDFNIWEKYWNTARMSTDFRESILRYANFLDYKEQLLANKGRPKNYGASKPEMVNALKNIDDKAFWLSNDLLGAYDRISVAGSTIRERIIPFWSWQELNAKRYIQLYKNAANDSNLTMTIGKQLGVKSPLIAMKLGRLVIKTTAFTGLLQVWNNLLFPDEERVLPNDIKSNAHIILGKDEKGDILYFNRMGTLDDFISWFGLDYVPVFVRRVLKGEPLKDLLKEQTMQTMQAPINKLAQGAYPFHKLAFETVARRGLFPDVFKPGTIRDRWLHIARSFGLENEYIAMAGKPSKGYGESLKNLILYTIAPGEAAYRNTWDMKHEFLKKLGKGADGFWLTKTGDALYNMKLAIRYGDKEAFSKYFSTYVLEAEKQERDIESIEKGVMQSLKNMHPLSGMKEEELKAFAQTLSEDEKDTVDEAIKFYFETLAPTENF